MTEHETQEGLGPLLELPRIRTQRVADRRDCRADRRFAAVYSCYYRNEIASFAHSNTVSSASVSIVEPLDAIGPRRKGLLVSGVPRRLAEGLLVPESCVRGAAFRIGEICRRENRSDNGKRSGLFLLQKRSKGCREPAVKAGSRASPSRPRGRLPGPVNRNPSSTIARGAQGPATSNTMSDKDLHRTLALETAAKIDAIESEMARDFLRPGGAPTMFPNSAANSTLQRPSQQPDAAASCAAEGKDDKSIDALDIISEDWVGNVNAIRSVRPKAAARRSKRPRSCLPMD